MRRGYESDDARCDAVQCEISRCDGRRLLPWRVHVHLRSCARCAGFRVLMDDRADEFAVLVPAMSAEAARRVFEALVPP